MFKLLDDERGERVGNLHINNKEGRINLRAGQDLFSFKIVNKEKIDSKSYIFYLVGLEKKNIDEYGSTNNHGLFKLYTDNELFKIEFSIYPTVKEYRSSDFHSNQFPYHFFSLLLIITIIFVSITIRWIKIYNKTKYPSFKGLLDKTSGIYGEEGVKLKNELNKLASLYMKIKSDMLAPTLLVGSLSAFLVVVFLGSTAGSPDQIYFHLLSLLFAIPSFKYGVIDVIRKKESKIQNLQSGINNWILELNTLSETQKQKKCPECAESVMFTAKLCRYCGYRFENYIISKTL